MSLSRWIRDYLFFPLVGGRATLWALCRAALISMLLCGLWHGAGWTFVLWGLYHGVLIAGFHVLTHGRRAVQAPAPARASTTPTFRQATWARVRAAAAVALTFGLVSLGWIFFRAPSVGQAFTLLGHALAPWAYPHRALSGTFYLHTAALVGLAWVAPALGRVGAAIMQWGKREQPVPGFAVAAARGVLLGSMIALAVLYLHGQTAFIYFQF
jgi:alginate O-acetyltransferase complex protein AlgI